MISKLKNYVWQKSTELEEPYLMNSIITSYIRCWESKNKRSWWQHEGS